MSSPAGEPSTQPSTPTSTAPPGYKLLKIREADGSSITVKKKLSREELEKDAPAEAATDSLPTSTTQHEAEFKVVTVRMPDGSLAHVRRPAHTTDTEATSAVSAGHVAHTSNGSTSEIKDTNVTAEKKDAPKQQDVKTKTGRRARFKKALVRDLVGAVTDYVPDIMDGDELISDSDIETSDDDNIDEDGYVDVPDDGEIAAALVGGAFSAASTTTSKSAPKPGPPGNPSSPPGVASEEPTGDDKTPKMTNENLKAPGEKAGESVLERRWAQFSFYLMAGLSILLPLLFLILTAFIIAMDGKSTSSSWGQLVDPIKIAVTVWPIVFAAVTAQAFKTWATYRVERGVKLMELEQLVGSNSFANVIKQPFLLRRLDLLTLFVLLVWALSPIGSQALLRVYTLELATVSDTVPVRYVPLLGQNQLLSPGAGERLGSPLAQAQHWQDVCMYFMSVFLPTGGVLLNDPALNLQDNYNNPMPRRADDDIISHFGILLALHPPVVQFETDEGKNDAAKDTFENVSFPIVSSYYEFTCRDWETRKRSDLDKPGRMNFSLAETLGIDFFTRIVTTTSTDDDEDEDDTDPTSINVTSINTMLFATLLNASEHLNETDWRREINPDPAWDYATIECGFNQVFYRSTVNCWVDPRTGSSSFSCGMDFVAAIPDQEVDPAWHTNLVDFGAEFVWGGSPYPVLWPYTPTEIYTLKAQGTSEESTTNLDPLSQRPQDFATRFAKLFNTFVTIAHCPQCIPLSNLSSLSKQPSNLAALYVSPNTTSTDSPGAGAGLAKRTYSPPGLIFNLNPAWLWILLCCTAILFLVGLVSVGVESTLVAPDVLGYASTLARNSRYLHLPRGTAGTLATKKGPQRARVLGAVRVMMQDVKPSQEVGKIALGLKTDEADKKLRAGRVYR